MKGGGVQVRRCLSGGVQVRRSLSEGGGGGTCQKVSEWGGEYRSGGL